MQNDTFRDLQADMIIKKYKVLKKISIYFS